MSMSVDGNSDVYVEHQVKARKAHECDCCDLGVRAGDLYWRIRKIYEGNVESYKRCLRCQTIHVFLRGVVNLGDEWPDERLACGHEFTELHGEPPPPDIARLAFLTPDEVQEQLR